MKLPDLVVFDVDGTLLDWDGTLSPHTAVTLASLRRRGIPIVLATGRPHAIADQTIEHVGGADWIVCGNGAVLIEVATGRLHRDSCLPSDVVLPLIHGMRERLPGIGLTVEVGNRVIEEVGFSRRVPEPSLHPPVADVVAALPSELDNVRRLIAFHDDFDDRLDELASVISSMLDDRCHEKAAGSRGAGRRCGHDPQCPQVQYGGLAFVDVTPRGDHKAVALQQLIEHLGLQAESVVAFGDGRNDIEMLRWAGTGVAMGNAHPDAKAAADAVTDSIDRAGVSAFLDPLLR